VTAAGRQARGKGHEYGFSTAALRARRNRRQVDLAKLFGPLEAPVCPERWYILQRASWSRGQGDENISPAQYQRLAAAADDVQNVTKYRRGYTITLEQSVTSPMITGVILIPDFEANGDRWQACRRRDRDLLHGDVHACADGEGSRRAAQHRGDRQHA
jgi:hypothetical protein